jgi:KUP system potassium uptake protein
MTERWRWPVSAALAVSGVFLTVDMAFLGANALKIGQGGWLPLVIAAVLFTLMTTWKTGRQILAERLKARSVPFSEFLATVTQNVPLRVPGTAVFMTAHPGGTPPALVHNLRYNKVLHQYVVVLMVRTRPIPHVPPTEQVSVEAYGHGVFNVVVSYGFMQDPDVPEALRLACERGLEVDMADITFFLGRETIVVTRREGMALWRERLFAVMSKNAVRATGFFRLPPERVVELGVQVEM